VRVVLPNTLNEALDAMRTADKPLTPVAGGTDLLVSWYHRPHDDLRFLDLSRLESRLRPHRLTDNHLELGALTTYWDITQDAEAAAAFPLLVEAGRQVGAVQIQTRGTWAGNIANASPAADGVAVLMAYDARVILQSSLGATEVPLDQYYTGYKAMRRKPDQLIVAIRLPRRQRTHEWFHKVGARQALTITKVGVAIVNDTDGWRIVANSVAPTILRCTALEQALDADARSLDLAEIRQLLASDITPIDDIRSTAAYRLTVLSRLLYHWLEENA